MKSSPKLFSHSDPAVKTPRLRGGYGSKIQIPHQSIWSLFGVSYLLHETGVAGKYILCFPLLAGL